MSVNPNDLRALADFLDERPALAERVYCPSLHIIEITRDGWLAALQHFGSFQKEDAGPQLWATRQFGSVELKVIASKEKTCERVQVGERVVEREVYPDDVKPTIETVTEPVYEWMCPPSWIAEPVA